MYRFTAFNLFIAVFIFFLLFDGRTKKCECQTFPASRLIELKNTRYDLNCRVLRILCRENGKAMNNLPAFASKKVFPQVLDKQGEQTQVIQTTLLCQTNGNRGGKGALELIDPQSQVDR